MSKHKNRPTKVLLVSVTGGWGGDGQVLVSLGRFLRNAGWGVLSACPVNGLLSERLSSYGIEVKAFDPVLLNLANGLYDLIRQYAAVRRANRQIYKIIQTENVDIVHANTIQGHWNAFIGARRARVPIIFHAHDIPSNSMLHHMWTLSCLYYCDAIIAVSRAVADYLRKCGVPSSKIHIINPPYNKEALRRGLKEDSIKYENLTCDKLPIIGFIGALSPRKAPLDIICAAKKLSSKGHSARFIFVGSPFPGDEEYAKMIQYLPKKLGIANYVQFTGFQINPFEWLKHFDVFVITSTQDPCPLVVFEAMELGKPVIGTNVGGIPEQVLDGETGFIIPVNNPTALAEKLQILIKNPSLRQKMGEAGRQRVTSLFEPRKMLTKILALYQEVLSNHKNKKS